MAYNTFERNGKYVIEFDHDFIRSASGTTELTDKECRVIARMMGVAFSDFTYDEAAQFMNESVLD